MIATQQVAVNARKLEAEALNVIDGASTLELRPGFRPSPLRRTSSAKSFEFQMFHGVPPGRVVLRSCSNRSNRSFNAAISASLCSS